jgi:1-acyl-sn-glycerol-3-phosphate acyltransferase
MSSRRQLRRLGGWCFYGYSTLSSVLFAAIALLVRPLPLRLRFHIISGWARSGLWALRLFCGVSWRVIGREHIPAGTAIIACKHQSAFETLALQQIFPPHCWVLKRELLRIPFFGWGLASLEPIAIDRGNPRRALKQVFDQGLERLGRGVWVLLFPEGTRVEPGSSGRYAQSAAALAIRAGVPVVPVAHNAGLCWPRSGTDKYSGLITIEIGPPIDPAGRTPAELTDVIEQWIETRSQHWLEDAAPSA